MDIVDDEDDNNNNNIIIADIVHDDNSPNKKIEEYEGVDQNFEQYINNDTIENKIFDFQNNKLNFSFQNKTFINCHFYNYKNRPFYDRNLHDDFKNGHDDEDTIFEVNVKNSNFINCRFDEIIFFKATFDNNTTFENCFFHEIDLFFSKFNKCNMAGSNFSHCDFTTDNEFNNCEMARIEFNNCKIAGCNFTNSNLSECEFYNCDMNYKSIADSYIIIDNRRIYLREYIDPKQLEYTSKIRHLSLKSIGDKINIRIQKIIKTTKQELASKNINNDPREFIFDYLFPRINTNTQRSRSREIHINRSRDKHKNSPSRSRTKRDDIRRDVRERSRSRDRNRRYGGKGKKTRKNQK